MAATDLIRVVAVDGALVPDPRRVLPGRGAHVHRVAACIEAAERRRVWPRALRMAGPIDGSSIRGFAHQTHAQHVLNVDIGTTAEPDEH